MSKLIVYFAMYMVGLYCGALIQQIVTYRQKAKEDMKKKETDLEIAVNKLEKDVEYLFNKIDH